MDPISTIVTDTVAKLQAAFTETAGPPLNATGDGIAWLVDAARPAVASVTSGVTAMQTFCGPQMFATILLVGGGFIALALGSAVMHRYP
ncbi:MAG: hypothetical protein J0J04_08575 [Microbacterium sp.]|uniref:hypothetical protein n=1 Tax=Microbacterium sp. TaxID=51671 RepID=UPI001ACE9BA4|nr:hypothetical protein [Microbacterium sp.]MBN9214831.1 hypothetical protein [Microbacterium sp.]